MNADSSGSADSNCLDTTRQHINLALVEALCSRRSSQQGENQERSISPTKVRELSTARIAQELQIKTEALASLKQLHDDTVEALDKTPDDERLLKILKDVSADLQLLEIEVSAQQLWEHTEAVERFSGVVDLTSMQRPLEEEWTRQWAGTLLKKLGQGVPGQPWKQQHMRIMRRKMETQAKKNATKVQHENSNSSGQNESPGAMQVENLPLIPHHQQQTQLQRDVPSMYWDSPSAIGNMASRVSISAMKVGTRYYAAAGAHAVKNTDGSLDITRPGCENGRFDTQVIIQPPMLPVRRCQVKTPTRVASDRPDRHIKTTPAESSYRPITPQRDGSAVRPSRLRSHSPVQLKSAAVPPRPWGHIGRSPSASQAPPGKRAGLSRTAWRVVSPDKSRTDTRSNSSPSFDTVRMPLEWSNFSFAVKIQPSIQHLLCAPAPILLNTFLVVAPAATSISAKCTSYDGW
jgi:hypothetical protein